MDAFRLLSAFQYVKERFAACRVAAVGLTAFQRLFQFQNSGGGGCLLCGCAYRGENQTFDFLLNQSGGCEVGGGLACEFCKSFHIVSF